MPTRSRTDPQGPDSAPPRSFAGLDREKLGLFLIPLAILLPAIAIAAVWVGATGAVIVFAVGSLILFVATRRDQREPVEVLSSDDATHRVLVIANEGLGGEPLTSALRSSRNGGDAHVRVIVPALAGTLDRLAGDVDDNAARAESDAERLVGEINGAGFDADAIVGDSDPTQALEDALKTYPADEVIVVNPAEGNVGRMERAATLRAKDATPLPFTEVRAG